MNDKAIIAQPLYQKIYSEIKKNIFEGVFGQAEKLPSENELCSIFNVSRITIRKALDMLTEDGLVVKIQGKGSYANASNKMLGQIEATSSFSEFATAQGKQHNSTILKREILQDKYIAEKLNLAADKDLIFIQRILTLDDVPLMLDKAWLPASLFPNLLTEISEKKSLYETLSSIYHEKVVDSRKELNVSLPKNKQAQFLEVAENTPLFIVNKVALNQYNIPIEFSQLTVRGDKMTYLIDSSQGHFAINSKK